MGNAQGPWSIQSRAHISGFDRRALKTPGYRFAQHAASEFWMVAALLDLVFVLPEPSSDMSIDLSRYFLLSRDMRIDALAESVAFFEWRRCGDAASSVVVAIT